MREITSHKINFLNKAITITVMDKPDQAGATHTYTMSWKNKKGVTDTLTIYFQQGLVQREGINGLSNEVLLAIVKDRLECFQAGPFPCEENAQTLACVHNALLFLESRVKDRISRAVDDTYKP